VHHDRRIEVACDDSVTRMVAGAPQPVRRSRGYAPMPLRLPLAAPPMVAVGAEIKAAAAVATGDRCWLTQHIGDVASLETLDMLRRSIATLRSLQRVVPEVVVSDAHPGYLSRRWAGEFAAELGARHVTVQHHHAHLASLLAEHRVPPDEPVLGVVFDGTGYGSDGTIWGGELLLGSYRGVRRVGHLRPVQLPGGDAAIAHPARVAIAHLAAAGIDPSGTASARAMPEPELRLLQRMLTTGSHCTPTTSMGRLFDAVASLLDVRHAIDYEAQAAIELEALAAGVAAEPWQARVLDTADGVVIDPGGWLSAAASSTCAQQAAAAFHAGVAEAVAEAVGMLLRRHRFAAVGLTGGVFANAVLTGQVVRRLPDVPVLLHRSVPPNDGGLALGQVCVAAANSDPRVG
jgi:hydrogenase maturation protein HypF